jgi:hypothetical protein
MLGAVGASASPPRDPKSQPTKVIPNVSAKAVLAKKAFCNVFMLPPTK